MKTNKLFLVVSAFALTGILSGCNKTKTYKVAFVEDYQGGKTTFVDVQEGKRVAEPATPVRTDGAVFNGWRIGSDDTSTRFDFDIPIYQDVVFYGSWIEHYEPITEVDELTFKRGLATCALGHATASFNKCEFSNDDYIFSNSSSGNSVYKNLVIKNNGELEHIKGIKVDSTTSKNIDVEFYNQYDDVRNEYHKIYYTKEVYGDYYGELKDPRTYIRSIESESTSKFTSLISSFLYSNFYELNYSLFNYNKNTKMYETSIGNLAIDGNFKIKFENGYITKLIFRVVGKATYRTLLDIDVDFIDIEKTKIDFPKKYDVKVFDFANKLDSSYTYTPKFTSIILYADIDSADTEMKFTPSISLEKVSKDTSGGAPASTSINIPISSDDDDDLNYFLVGAYKDSACTVPLTIENKTTIKGLNTVTSDNKIYVKTGIGSTTGSTEFTKGSTARTSTNTFKFINLGENVKTIDVSDNKDIFTNKVFSHESFKTIIEDNIDLNGYDFQNVLFNFSSTTEGVKFYYDYNDGGKKLGNYPNIELNLNKGNNSFEVDINIEIGYSGKSKTLKIIFDKVNTYYEAQTINYVGGQAPTSPLEYTIDTAKRFVGTTTPAVVQDIRDFYNNKSTNQNIAVKLEANNEGIEVAIDDGSGDITFTCASGMAASKIEGLILYIGVTENGNFVPLDFIKVNINKA